MSGRKFVEAQSISGRIMLGKRHSLSLAPAGPLGSVSKRSSRDNQVPAEGYVQHVI